MEMRGARPRGRGRAEKCGAGARRRGMLTTRDADHACGMLGRRRVCGNPKKSKKIRGNPRKSEEIEEENPKKSALTLSEVAMSISSDSPSPVCCTAGLREKRLSLFAVCVCVCVCE